MRYDGSRSTRQSITSRRWSMVSGPRADRTAIRSRLPLRRAPMRTRVLFVLSALLLFSPELTAGEAKPYVYVILWFDTEDYLLPASDDAALQVADFLTRQGIRATFKVVGE